MAVNAEGTAVFSGYGGPFVYSDLASPWLGFQALGFSPSNMLLNAQVALDGHTLAVLDSMSSQVSVYTLSGGVYAILRNQFTTSAPVNESALNRVALHGEHVIIGDPINDKVHTFTLTPACDEDNACLCKAGSSGSDCSK